MRRIIALVIFVSSFLSCHKEVQDTNLGVDGITFSVDSVLTRGSVINNINISSMMLFCHTAPSLFNETTIANYMYKAQSELVSGKWITQPASGDAISNTAWDGDNYHSFFAFAPYDISNVGTLSAQTAVGPPTFSYTMPNSPIDHKDLLCSSHTNAIHYYLTSKPVNLTFAHALSKITFSANKTNYEQAGTIEEQVVVKSFTFSNIWDTATLTFKEAPVASGDYIGEWDYSDSGPKIQNVSTSIAKTSLNSHVLNNTMTNITAGDGAVMPLPQLFDANAILTVVMDITKSVAAGGTVTSTTHEYIKQFDLATIAPSGWVMGKSYNYKLTYNGDGALPSSVEVSMTDWNEEIVDGDVSGTYLDVANIEYETDNSVKIYYSTNDPENISWSDNNYGTITHTAGSDYLLYTPDAVGIDNIKITAGNLSRTVDLTSSGIDPTTVTPVPFIGNTYIGAFWKAADTQERLIDMNQENVISWTAKVIWIDDRWDIGDIVLDTDYPATFPIDDNTAPVNLTSTLSSISGTGDIKFRIGLKTTYTPTVAFPVRYALVLVESDANKQFIYLRQGENPDYLMRQGDKDGNGNDIANLRSFARKISAYNLTASDIKDGIATGGSLATDGAQHPRLTSNGLGVFVDYPTQGGAFWQHMTPSTGANFTNYARRAYHPTNSVAAISSWQGNLNFGEFWSSLQASQEVSPSNYLINNLSYNFGRVNDGTITGNNSAGSISGSEIRQSVWLNPSSGASTVNNSNLVSGYYADGFFDRKEIVDSDNGIAKSAVLPGTGNVAYAGRIFFNPITYASLFFPACGYRSYNNGQLLGSGSGGGYWTGTTRNAANGWCFYTYTISGASATAGQYLAARPYGFAIRPIVTEP